MPENIDDFFDMTNGNASGVEEPPSRSSREDEMAFHDDSNEYLQADAEDPYGQQDQSRLRRLGTIHEEQDGEGESFSERQPKRNLLSPSHCDTTSRRSSQISGNVGQANSSQHASQREFVNVPDSS